MADTSTLLLLVTDIGIGAVALGRLHALSGKVSRIARRVGVVEQRTTPPPGTLATITDIASGPVRPPRAQTKPGG